MRRAIRAALVSFALCLGVSAQAHADQAADVFNAWSSAFFLQKNGQTFYSNSVVTKAVDHPAGWEDASVIYVAEDVYEREPTAAHRQLIDDLVTTFLANDGTDWSGDGWNDDLAWMVTAVLRAYQITGKQAFFDVAQKTWNLAYDRGWDTHYAGGGVWESMSDVAPTFKSPAKCALSNDPLVTSGLLLYQLTADASYLAKSKNMYDWVKKSLVTSTGQVNGCVLFNASSDTAGEFPKSDDAYNTGSFVEAAEYFYRITGDQAYYNDALLSVTYRVTTDPILHKGDQGANQWAYHFTKGLNKFATFNGLWNRYQPWMESNAKAAWSQRNALDVTWNDWTKPTVAPGVSPANDITALCTSSAAGIWQHIPPAPKIPMDGMVELQNVRSSLSVTAALNAGGAADGGPVIQAPFAGDESLWTFEATSGAYYRLKNVESGLFLSVEGNSAKLGATIVASQASVHAAGNDQWLPVLNGDGTYAFYNLSTILALDDPQASQTSGTQFAQWTGNDTDGQHFKLIPHAPAPANDAGIDAAPADASSDAMPPDGSVDAAVADAAVPIADAGQGSAGSSSSGCGCQTAGTPATPRSTGELFALASGALAALAFRKRRLARRLSGRPIPTSPTLPM